MFKIYLGFQEKILPTKYKIGIEIFILFFILSYGLKAILTPQSALFHWLNSSHKIIFNNVIILEVILLIAMLIAGKKIPDKNKKKINNAFAYSYLSRYGYLLLFALLAVLLGLPRLIRLFLAAGLLIFFNIIPFLWYKYSFLKYSESMLKYVEDKGILDSIHEKYHISKREKEILELILDGKSNKEIKEILFISYHTVKAHIYNLYQKLGVNTRYELIHLITKFQNR